MTRITFKKTAIIFLLVVVVFVVSGIGIYSYYKVQHLRTVEAVYNKGISLMDEKKYLEAEKELSKISKEDTNLYNKAQDKIKQCKEQYIKQNIELANNSIKENKYEESANYIEAVLKVDNKNEEANKLKDNLDKKIQEQFAQNMKEQEKEVANKTNSNITPEEAVKIVEKYVKGSSSDIKYAYDHIQSRDGKDYYVIQVYENMQDHITTLGWYYVDVKTGEAFEWDLINDKLNSVK